MESRADYAELVARAEQAVAAVQDPELKRIAFQKILDDLLKDPSSDSTQKKAVAKRKSATTKSVAGSRTGPHAYVQELIADGFFKKPRTIADVKAELENRGHHIPLTSLSGPLQKLCQKKRLRRQRTPGTGNKQTYAYSEW